MRYEVRGYRHNNGERFYLVDLENQQLVSVEGDHYGSLHYGTEAQCEKKLMQLLAEGGRPTEGAK